MATQFVGEGNEGMMTSASGLTGRLGVLLLYRGPQSEAVTKLHNPAIWRSGSEQTWLQNPCDRSPKCEGVK